MAPIVIAKIELIIGALFELVGVVMLVAAVGRMAPRDRARKYVMLAGVALVLLGILLQGLGILTR
jgi:hypothetical protein